jgi:PAS domain-containing protein
MRTDTIPPVRQSPGAAPTLGPADRPIARDTLADGPDDAPGRPFSRVACEHHLGDAAVDLLLGEIGAGVLVTDGDGRVLYANAEARRLTLRRVAPLWWAVTRALLTEENVRDEEIEHVTRGEPSRSLRVSVWPVRHAGSGPHAAVVTVTDVTATRQAARWQPLLASLARL